MKDLKKLRDYAGEDKVIESTDYEKELQSVPEGKIFKSKYPMLDEFINGFQQGEVIAVSGPRKCGKTLFCQSVTYRLNEQDVSPLWIQFENTAKQFYKNFQVLGTPHFLIPKKLKSNSTDWVEERLAESIAKYGAGALFIDHLHYIVDIFKAQRMDIEVGQVIRKLKMMAVEYNVVIFIMNHLKKVPLDREPDDTDFRDSSLIASETDTGLIIWREAAQQKTNEAFLKVCYSRRTGCFKEKITLVKKDGILEEKSAGYAPAPQETRRGDWWEN